jgi:hypothetical protein
MRPVGAQALRCEVSASNSPDETQLQQFNADSGKKKIGHSQVFLVVAAHPCFHAVRQLFYFVRFFDYIERKDVLIALVHVIFELG